jgi:hypothetical protein
MRGIFLFLTLLIVATGCSDSSKSGGAGGEAGAGGGGGGTGGDGGTGGQGFSVTVIGAGGPVVNAPAMYATSDGTHLLTLMTDENGEATFTNVPPGGFITAPVVRDQDQAVVSLQTVGGIGNGDTIELRATTAEEVPIGTFSVAASNLSPGALNYNVFVPSEQFSSPDGSDRDFPPGPRGTLTASTIGPSGFFNAVGIANIDIGTVEIGWATDVPLVGAPPAQTADGSISNWSTPTGFIRAGIMNVSDSAFSVSIRVRGYRDTRPYQTKDFNSVVPNGQTFTAPLALSTSFNDRVIAIFTSPPSSGVSFKTQRVVAGEVSAGNTDLTTSTADFLPEPSGATRDIDARSSAYGWSPIPTCDGAAINASLLSFSGVLEENSSYSWTMLAPYSDTVTMPELDPDLADALFPVGIIEETWTLEARGYVDSDYETVRRTKPALLTPEQLLGRQEGSQEVCVATASAQ